MSYARFAKDSDVYVFFATHGRYECCSCALADGVGECTLTDTPEQMVEHLEDHVQAGHDVPQETMALLLDEAHEPRENRP